MAINKRKEIMKKIQWQDHKYVLQNNYVFNSLEVHREDLEGNYSMASLSNHDSPYTLKVWDHK